MAPDVNPERRLDLPSPDGTKVIEVRGFRVRLRMNEKLHWTPFGNFHDAEVAWAPDSARLFVSWTETGQLGPWHTQIYDVTPVGLVEVRGVTRNLRPDLIARIKKAPLPTWVRTQQERDYWAGLDYCAYDVVGSQWLNGSNEILVAAIGGPDSGCKYMSQFVAYRVEVATGKILQAYGAREAQRLFGKENLPAVDVDDVDL